MSWDCNIYSHPEKFGLQIIGEVEFSSGSYEFDTSVVWQDLDTKNLYVGDDSGCPCPMPFENVGRSDIRRIDRAQDLIDYFEERKRDCYRYTDNEWDQDSVAEIDAACGEVILKAREAARA